MPKGLNKRKCKNCGLVFQKKTPLQFVCSVSCSIEYAKKQREKKEKKEKKDWNKRKAEMRIKVKSTDYKKELQTEINKLARKIDSYFNLNCIDCGKPFTGQVDGAHFHNVGGNENLRYNLHNIHSAKSHCNRHDSEHKARYPKGIEDRYGADYLEYVQFTIRNDYKVLKLTEQEVYDKLKIVRKLNRD